MESLRTRLSFAPLMSMIAVFVVLGGGAYAAIDLVGKNDIKSKHIKNGQVKPKDVADNALTGTDIKEESLYLWAVVNEDATLARAGQGKTSVVDDGTGAYEVHFNRDITGCAYVATLGLAGAESSEDPGVVTVVRDASSPDDTVLVNTHDLDGQFSPRGFHLAVHC